MALHLFLMVDKTTYVAVLTFLVRENSAHTFPCDLFKCRLLLQFQKWTQLVTMDVSIREMKEVKV